jgi:predicted MFS family arabinose efflux permease
MSPVASGPLAAWRLSALLFCCLLAAQSGILVVAPILADVARDFGVSNAAVGQLRAVSGAVGGVAALVVGFGLGRRRSLRELLRGGLALIAAGALVSAAAPSFAVLAAAQVAIGAGATAVLAAGIAAAGAWAAPDDRSRVLAWAVVGQPGAWVLGLPIIGVVGEISWRLAWLAVPVVAAVVALLALQAIPAQSTREETRPQTVRSGAWTNPRVLGWAAGELCANSAWAGLLVYAGAHLADDYGLSAAAVAMVLAAAATAYFPGAFAARRLSGLDPRLVLAACTLALGAAAAAFLAPDVGAGAGIAIFTVSVAITGARSLVTSAFGMDAAPDEKVTVMGLRAATMQFGYLIGAGAGGLALAAGGYGALGTVLATLFVLAAFPHLASWSVQRAATGRLAVPQRV